MAKKTIYYILGGVAILGVGYYIWNKRKKPVEQSEVSEEKPVGESKEVKEKKKEDKKEDKKTKEEKKEKKPSVTKLTADQLESKLKSRCGKKPILKKWKDKYNKCREDYKATLRKDGYIDFEGYFENNNNYEGFYSSFENNLDLDL